MSVAVVARKLEQLERGDEQEVLVKAGRVAEPCENDEIGGRGWPKARRSNIHGGAEASLVNDHCLDLNSHNPPAVEVQDGQPGVSRSGNGRNTFRLEVSARRRI